MQGRIDLERYTSGIKTMKNFIAHPARRCGKTHIINLALAQLGKGEAVNLNQLFYGDDKMVTTKKKKKVKAKKLTPIQRANARIKELLLIHKGQAEIIQSERTQKDKAREAVNFLKKMQGGIKAVGKTSSDFGAIMREIGVIEGRVSEFLESYDNKDVWLIHWGGRTMEARFDGVNVKEQKDAAPRS